MQSNRRHGACSGSFNHPSNSVKNFNIKICGTKGYIITLSFNQDVSQNGYSVPPFNNRLCLRHSLQQNCAFNRQFHCHLRLVAWINTVTGFSLGTSVSNSVLVLAPRLRNPYPSRDRRSISRSSDIWLSWFRRSSIRRTPCITVV